MNVKFCIILTSIAYDDIRNRCHVVFEEALNMLTRSLEKAKAAFKRGDAEASRKAHLLLCKADGRKKWKPQIPIKK